MSKRILWVDNDKLFLGPHIIRLRAAGYNVDHALTLMEGVKKIERGSYDLLILDVMMPVKEEEENLFPAKDTNSGKQAGFVFYRNFKSKLAEKGIILLVFTIRAEPELREQFLDAGLPPQNFMTKSEGADTAVFLTRVKELLGEGVGP